MHFSFTYCLLKFDNCAHLRPCVDLLKANWFVVMWLRVPNERRKSVGTYCNNNDALIVEGKR